MQKVPVPQPKRGISRHLTEKQRKFAELLIENAGKKTATECAIEAGYPKETARVKASQLQNPKNFPVVYNYIQELREEVRKKFDVTVDGHLAELAKIRDTALGRNSFASAVNAEIARGKVGGLYIDQKKILSLSGKIENMDPKSLEEKFKKLLDDHSTLIGEVDVNDIKEKLVDYSSSSQSSDSSSNESS